MKYTLTIFAFLLARVLAVAQFYPPVSVTTNAVLVYPTNFFVANSNALNAAVAGVTSDVEVELAGKLNATNGIASGLQVVNGFDVTGDSIFDKVQGFNIQRSNAGAVDTVAIWDSSNYITNGAVTALELSRLGGIVSSVQGQLDALDTLIDNANAAKLDANGGIGTNLASIGTFTGEIIVADYFQRSLIGNTNKVAVWGPDNVLTNSTVSISDLESISSDFAAKVDSTNGSAVNLSVSGGFTVTGTANFDTIVADFESPHLANSSVVASWDSAGLLTNSTVSVSDLAGFDGRITSLEGSSGSGAIPVANPAAMVVLAEASLTNGVVFVQTAGRTTAGVGGALFRYDSGSSATTNLGTVFAHATIAGRFIYAGQAHPNADMFGAIPDTGGVDNGSDTAAIQSALDTLPKGSILRFNVGTYRAIGLVNNRGISLIGDRGSHPARASLVSGTQDIFAWGVGSEIEADGAGWILSMDGRPGGMINTASGDPNQEGQLSGAEIAYISFFGKGRTLEAGGIKAQFIDEMLIHNCGFYGLRKAGYWAKGGVREGNVSDNDFRHCGDADDSAGDSPDPVRGWAAMMLFDVQTEAGDNIGDHNNFNKYRGNQVSYSLGSACILDSLEVFKSGDDVIFDEQFEGNTWHGYLQGSTGGSNVLFFNEWVASVNMRSSPVFIVRAADRIKWIGDKFWFTGDGGSHLTFESNTTAPDLHDRISGTYLAQVIGCTFYGNYNNQTNTPFVKINSGSRASVSDCVFITGANQVKVLDNGTPNDAYISSGRQHMAVLAVEGAATVGGSAAVTGGLTVGSTGLGIGRTGVNSSSALVQMDSTTKGFLPPRVTSSASIAGPVEGLIAAETTIDRPIYYDGAAWKNIAFTTDISGSGGGGDVEVLETMAELMAYTGSAPLVYLEGYHSGYKGVGNGFWRWDATSTLTTNRATVKPTAASSGRYIPVFYNGEVDITRFGARHNVTDNTAVADAWSMAQNNSLRDNVLFVPGGNYQITGTLANVAPTSDSTVGTRFLLRGINRGFGNSNNGPYGASRLTMMTDNTPICSVTGAGNMIEGISLAFNSVQPPANTEAICIKHNQAVDLNRSRFQNLHLKNGAYGYYSAQGTSVYQANNTWDNILIDRYTQTAWYGGAAGTTTKLGHFYIQNFQSEGADSPTISSASKSGAEITLVLSSLPVGLTTNCFMYVDGVYVNGVETLTQGYKVCKYMSGTTVKFDMTSDPGAYTPTLSSATLTFAPKNAYGTKGAMFFGENMEFDAVSIDVENTIQHWGCLIYNEGVGTIGNLHSEFTYSNTNFFAPVFNRGSLKIGTAVTINTGAPTGTTGSLFLNQNSTGGLIGKFSIGNLNLRDISNVANTVHLANKWSSSVEDIRIENIRDMGTVRANATSSLTIGDVYSYTHSGVATLVAGSVTVAADFIDSSSRIIVTPKTPGGTPGILSTGTRVNGTSFTITSSSGTDTSTVDWTVIEP